MESWGLEPRGNDGPVKIDFAIVGNVFTRSLSFAKAGDSLTGHQHAFDHLSLLAHGAIRAEVDTESKEFTAPCFIFIEHGKVHRFTALKDETELYCIHAIRDGGSVDDIVTPEMTINGQTPTQQSSAWKPEWEPIVKSRALLDLVDKYEGLLMKLAVAAALRDPAKVNSLMTRVSDWAKVRADLATSENPSQFDKDLQAAVDALDQ